MGCLLRCYWFLGFASDVNLCVVESLGCRGFACCLFCVYVLRDLRVLLVGFACWSALGSPVGVI